MLISIIKDGNASTLAVNAVKRILAIARKGGATILATSAAFRQHALDLLGISPAAGL